MQAIKCKIDGLYIIAPTIFPDDRGYFFESYNEARFSEQIGAYQFVQDNESRSSYGVLRGLHYQLPPFAQAKLARVVEGKVLDIAVDIRKNSPTFGRHVSVELSGENKKQFFMTEGFAHGFVVLSETAIFQYKVTAPYSKQNERGILFNDPSLAIDWKIPTQNMILSDKDRLNPPLKDAEL